MPPELRLQTGAAFSPSSGAEKHKNRVRAALAFAALLGCMVAIYLLSSDARREINTLATANADSTQWALAQSEVEILSLLAEARRTDMPADALLRSVRRRFDIYYSRVQTLRVSAVMSGLRDDVRAAEGLSRIQASLEAIVPIIDGSDDALLAALPDIAARVEAMRGDARSVSLIGVEHFSQLADLQRERVTGALVRLGVVILLLVAALSAVVAALLRSIRRAQQGARSKAEAQHRLEVIVGTSLDAIVVVDRNGRFVDFNKAAESIFGYSRAEIIGTRMVDSIMPEKHHAAHEAGMKKYLETGEPRLVGKGRVQIEARHKTGRVFPIEMSIASGRSSGGEIFVAYIRDITTRIAKQQELVRARDEAVAGDRKKADLVAVMSHEMRTPLNGIVGALELLRTTELDKKQRYMTEVMGTSANMLLHHVNDVLDMSRLESGVAEAIKRPFNPVSVCQEVVQSLRLTAQKGGNKLSLASLDPDFTLVMGDSAKLRQIVTNLVGNAIKFTRQGTITVEIEPHHADGVWELRVTDDGIGISDEDQKRIFDDFVTLDPSYTRAQEGTGLGLAIVRRLASHMGGEVGVESILGEGSVFWVRLPIALGPRDMDQAASPDPVPASNKLPSRQTPLSILLVEDNEINRVVAVEMLKILGHSVDLAHNGVEGVRMAELRRFDVILMDVSMPVMDGVEATRLIRSGKGPNVDVPIIAITAHAMPADIDRFTSAGMTKVLVKPLEMEGLRLVLHTWPEDKAALDKAHSRLTTEQLLDTSTAKDLKDALGADRFGGIRDLYLAELEKARTTIFVAVPPDDAAALRAEVHRLLGASSTLGAVALRDALRVVEEGLRDGWSDEMGPHVTALVALCAQTQAAFADFDATDPVA